MALEIWKLELPQIVWKAKMVLCVRQRSPINLCGVSEPGDRQNAGNISDILDSTSFLDSWAVRPTVP